VTDLVAAFALGTACGVVLTPRARQSPLVRALSSRLKESVMVVQIGKVKIPLFAVIRAVPLAVKAAAEEASDNKAPSSPGGAKVTPGEVGEVVLAFVLKLADIVAEPVLKANGLSA
jgi:hypothetical protein